MNEIILRAPASIANVGPGHDIFSLALAEPSDEIKIELNNQQNINIVIAGDNKNIPTQPLENTAGLAITELFRKLNIKTGINIWIKKHTPSGCGIGSTGASAAAAIYGVNQLLGLNLNTNEMIDYARMGEIASGGSPHADNVAAALLGGFTLINSNSPMRVTKIEVPVFPVVLAIIKKTMRTTRGFITYEIGQDRMKDQLTRCSHMIHSLYTKNIAEFGESLSVDHIAEPVRGAAIPEYFSAKKNILDAGAYGVNIAGGGSTVFAICPDSDVQKIAKIMENEFGKNPNFVKIITTTSSNKGLI